MVTFKTVANTGPLIHLARINKLNLIHSLFKEIHIPEAVKIETVDKGKTSGYTDAIAIERAISAGWIKITRTKSNTEKLAEEAKIGKSEAEAILLAKEINTTRLLIDDARARKIAQSLGLKPHGAIYILKLALIKKIISKTEYTQSLRKALETGLYLSTELYLQTSKEDK